MSRNNGRIPEPTEIIQLPRPSWAPAFFAGGLTLAIAGIYLEFMGPNWAYVVIGAVIALAAMRNMIRESRRDLYRLPREQEVRSAALPAASIKPPNPPA